MVDFDENGDVQNGFYSVKQIRRGEDGSLQFFELETYEVPF
jgi:hypothetical protein